MIKIATVNLSLSQLVGQEETVDEVLAQIHAMERAGLKVNLQVHETAGLKALQQLPEVQKTQKSPRLGLPALLTLGVFSGLAAIIAGLSGGLF